MSRVVFIGSGEESHDYCTNCKNRLSDSERDLRMCNDCVELIAEVSIERDGHLFVSCDVCKAVKSLDDIEHVDSVTGCICTSCYRVGAAVGKYIL